MKPPLGPGSRRRLFLGWGVPEASLEGWSGQFRRNDELQERRPRPPPRATSRAPAPAPVVACVEASYGSLRGAVVRARDVSFETETSPQNTQRGRSESSAGRRSRVPRRRLRRRGEPFGTSALARRGRSAVRGRVGQSPSIHLEPARCRRDARDPILIAEAQRTLPRRHAPPERRRARRLAHGVAGHDLVGFALAAAVAAAARAQLRGRRRP